MFSSFNNKDVALHLEIKSLIEKNHEITPERVPTFSDFHLNQKE
jgi:hypothetical protein